jgi:hypothetical protein
MSVRIQYELQGVAFEWDSDKADTNVQKNAVCLSTPPERCSLTPSSR